MNTLDLGSWCILRCSPCKTLDLAKALTEMGFDAWTPVETVFHGEKPLRKPLTVCYVFAAADRLHALLDLSHSPVLNYRVWDPDEKRLVTRSRPYFRLFRDFGQVAIIPGAKLEPLRHIERRRKPRGVIKPIEPGTIVRLTEGGFAGMTGTVGIVRGKYAMVSFVGLPLMVQFPTWLLREELDRSASVNVNTRATEQTARAA